jgi:hypothetical protein
VDARTNSKINGTDSIGSIFSSLTKDSEIEFVMSQSPLDRQWSYRFPITPQSISVVDQFAINTTPTMRGVVEEHNGVKFKNITMSGTTGVLPNKPSVAPYPSTPPFGGFFAGAIESAQKLAKQFDKLKKAFGGGNTSKAKRPGQVDKSIFYTGYYQALRLSQFLERYATAKKDPANRHWRLVLDIPKESQSFIVTPVSFSLQKSQQSPMEYIWSLQLKAWKRIELETPPPAVNIIRRRDRSLFQSINDVLRETRRTIAEATNVIKAIRSDVQGALNIVKQATLAIKDIGGFVFTVADLSDNLIRDCKDSIHEAGLNLKGAFDRDVASGKSLSDKTKAVFADLDTKNKNKEGLDPTKWNPNDTDSKFGAFEAAINNPAEYFEFFDLLETSQLNTNPKLSEAISIELNKAKDIEIADLKRIRSGILELALDISDNFGAGSGVYSKIYGRTAPKKRATPMNLEEQELLYSLCNSVQAIDSLTATKQFDDTKIQNPLEYVGGLAQESGIPFASSTSKYLVAVPFGLTIEEISARYLKNPDRWIEIVTLNNLRSPYIDEEGFSYDLLSNGSGRQFNVNDSQQRLFIGQRVLLRSSVVAFFSRKIINIEKISDTNYLVSVDGDSDLGNLKTSENAKIQAYLPGTVNSQDQIYIPSNQPAQADDRVQEIPAFKNDKITKISKVDWLLDESGDVAINNFGDFRLANGLNNLLQALRIKVLTQKNTILKHPDFGSSLTVGTSVAEINSGQVYNDLNTLITSDPRFSGLERFTITINGPTITIDMAVSIANNSGVLPISFTI